MKYAVFISLKTLNGIYFVVLKTIDLSVNPSDEEIYQTTPFYVGKRRRFIDVGHITILPCMEVTGTEILPCVEVTGT